MMRHCELLLLAVPGMPSTECWEASEVTGAGDCEAGCGSTTLVLPEVRTMVCTEEVLQLVGGHGHS